MRNRLIRLHKPLVETVYLTAFFRFHKQGQEYGFERIHLQHIWKTQEEALKSISFCDEAGYYEGVLIEERAFGWEDHTFRSKRFWFLQQDNGILKEVDEPGCFNDVVHLIG